jgi:hypothetical protein
MEYYSATKNHEIRSLGTEIILSSNISQTQKDKRVWNKDLRNGHECRRGTILGRGRHQCVGGGLEQARVTEGEYQSTFVVFMHRHSYENVIMKPIIVTINIC